MKVLTAFAQFSRNYLVARAYSQKTIDGYWWVIKSFVEAVGDIETQYIAKEHIAEWVEYMGAKGNGRATLHLNVSRLRVFIEYLNLEGICYLAKEQIVVPHKPKTIPKITTPQAIDKMIAAAPSLRDKTIIAVFFCTAMRNSELRNLKRADIYGRDVFIREGKGLKDRVVRLDERAYGLFQRYLISRMDASEYAFISRPGQPIASSTMRYIIHHSCELAGIPPISAHPIRHTSATYMMNHGAHLRLIQDYLGHSDPKVTELYTHVSHGDITEVHDRVFNHK